MNAQAQRMDVLAVLDRQMEFTIASDYPGASTDHRDMCAARDAVAELIDFLRDAECNCRPEEGPYAAHTCNRCRLLARITP
jgi:hypothetical protein